MVENTQPSFLEELRELCNRHSKENGSNTPDWILAESVMYFLTTLDLAINARDEFYGVRLSPGGNNVQEQKEEHMAEDYSEQVVFDLKLKIVDVLEKNQQVAKNSAEIKSGKGTQSVGQRLRLDCSPVDSKGNEFPGNSPIVNSPRFFKHDGTSPIIEYRWFVDGREASNSAQMPDPFHLGSYDSDNAGCTPSLKLETPVGEGRHQVVCHAFVNGEFNGGKEVQSKVVEWWCD